MVYKSVVGELLPIPTGNAVAGFFESPQLNRSDIQDFPLFTDAITEKAITIKQYRKLVSKVSGVFRTEFNVNKGDVVGLFAPNIIFTPAVHLATLSLGAVLSPANVVYNSQELAHQFRMTNPKICITADPLLETAKKAAELAKITTIIVKLSELVELMEYLLTSDNVLTVDPVTVDNKTTPAYCCFSSGTSGLPKGVIITHSNILSNTIQIASSGSPHFAGNHQLSQSCVLPMSHIFSLITSVWSGPYSGRNTVIFPKFDLEGFVAGVCKYKIGILNLVPPIILTLAKQSILDKYPEFGETAKVIFCGAAPLSKETIELFLSRCPKVLVTQGYGLTETTVTHMGSTSLWRKYDSASIGWLLPGVEAKLVDPESGKEITGFNRRGEIWVRGPMVMAGYLNNVEATNDCITPQRWFKTGDIALVREDQQFYIVDRIKELIKSKGHQVAPAELENILLTNPNVVDAAVIGVYNKDKTSEMPRAYLVLRHNANPKDVVTWFNRQVSKYKRLWGGAIHVKEIPKSSTGKILRKDLRLRKEHDKDVIFGMEVAAL